MISNILLAAGLVLCVFLSAFCSSAEMTYSSCNTVRLENLRDDGEDKRAKTACRVCGSFADTLGAILISNNLANIAASSIASVLVLSLLGEGYSWLATLTVTVVVIIFGETIPKIVAKKNSNSLALSYAGPVRAMTVILLPLIRLTVLLVNLISRLFRQEETEEDAEEAVEELQTIIETAENEDVLDEDRSELLQAAIDFSDVSAYEVMTARVDVYALDTDDSFDEILRKVEASPYTRLPVYEGSIDNIIGVLYLNSFLKALTSGSVMDIRAQLMPVCYIYKTVKLPEVLNTLRRARQHLAVVTDEYGGTLGVVSMEDVLEQIVGDIWDESDVVEEEIVEKNEGEYELDGDMMLSDFEELFSLDDEGFEAESETVGGWTVEMFGRYPAPGESFTYDRLTVTVLEADRRRVEKVRVVAAPEPEKE